jgi:hypothetical protein
MDGEIAQARMATVEPNDGDPTALAGTRSDFALLYEECRLPVYRFLRSRTRSVDEAADLTASAFERARGPSRATTLASRPCRGSCASPVTSPSTLPVGAVQ